MSMVNCKAFLALKNNQNINIIRYLFTKKLRMFFSVLLGQFVYI